MIIPHVLRRNNSRGLYMVALLAGLTIFGLWSASQPREWGRVQKVVRGVVLAILILILAALVWLDLNRPCGLVC